MFCAKWPAGVIGRNSKARAYVLGALAIFTYMVPCIWRQSGELRKEVRTTYERMDFLERFKIPFIRSPVGIWLVKPSTDGLPKAQFPAYTDTRKLEYGPDVEKPAPRKVPTIRTKQSCDWGNQDPGAADLFNVVGKPVFKCRG